MSIPIILCASQPCKVPERIERDYMRLYNLHVAYSSGEVGTVCYLRSRLKSLIALNPNFPFIVPLKPKTLVSEGNEYKWDRIIDEWKTSGAKNPVFYMDEPFNQGLWHEGTPLTGQSLIDWKIAQLAMFQRRINEVLAKWPAIKPLVTSDKPVPMAGTAISAPGLIRCYQLQHISQAVKQYGDTGWRQAYGIGANDPVAGYLISPIWGQGFTPQQAANFIKAYKLAGFLYYSFSDPDVQKAFVWSADFKVFLDGLK